MASAQAQPLWSDSADVEDKEFAELFRRTKRAIFWTFGIALAIILIPSAAMSFWPSEILGFLAWCSDAALRL